MKKRGSAVLLAAVCLLVGCAASDPALPAETSSPTETSSPAYQGDSLFAYCTERQRELLELPHEELVTAQGDTYSFWFDKRRFEGVDGRCYVLSGDEKLWELVWGIRTADPDYQDLMR